MISTQQQLLLKQYQEKSFVSSILAEEACNYFSFINKTICTARAPSTRKPAGLPSVVAHIILCHAK